MDEEVPLAVEIEAGEGSSKAVAEPAASHRVVPVTVITGFLGSGKTTLVRHILTGGHGYRIAVILNEYGEDTGIESSFVQDQQGLQGRDGEWIELTNGCMCCSVKNDFVVALEALLGRKDGFDYIVIETTGLANPGPIAAALWTDDEVEARVHLDSVVTVVDALNINRQLHEQRPGGAVNEAQLQIAYADLVILNKLDLAEEEAITRAEADIRAINSTVSILRTERAQVDLDMLLNRNGYTHKGEISLPPIAEDDDEEDAEGDAGGHAGPKSPQPAEQAGPGGTALAGGRTPSTTLHCCSSRAHSIPRGALDHAADQATGSPVTLSRGSLATHTPHRGADAKALDPSHDGSISTMSLRCDAAVDLERLKSWVDHLLWDREQRADEIYRMKGLLSVKGSEHKHMLQAVYELYDITTGPDWRSGEPRATRIVLIGRNLRQELLRASWNKFLEGS